MVRYFLNLISITLFILAIVLVGQQGARSDSAMQTSAKRAGFDASYRSPSARHKVVVQARDHQLRDSILADGGELVEDYGAFALYSAPTEAASRVSLQSLSGSAVRDDMNVILLRAGAFDTTAGEPVTTQAMLREPDASEEQLYLVQMIGPVKSEWLNQLRETAEIVSYVPNNAYLVRASDTAMAQINEMKSSADSFIQYTGAYRPAYKIAPEIYALEPGQELTLTVQLVTGKDTEREIQDLQARTSGTLVGEIETALGFTNLRVRVSPESPAEIARMSNVVWVEPWITPVMHDERQGLIVTGNYTDNRLAKTRYLNWIESKGISSKPDFLVDIADSGIDQGVLDPQVIHKDFLDSSGLSRVVYARFVGNSELTMPANDTGGHGTINAAIVAGFNNQTGFPYADAEGYSHGLGIHPFMKLGVTKIFAPEYTDPNLTNMVDMMYRDAARISSNSWGAYTNNYTVECQMYDSMVRDARKNEPGNQEMTVVFSSGNKGAGGNLSAPGSAKNVIMVGASENLRPGFDGCRVDSTGADDINSLINFSSGGPCADGRIKPDIVAPGTHIQGARSQDRGYVGSGVCGPADYPVGQSLYTWSSGTSHSAPAVSGAAALIRQFFQQTTQRAPSPAMLKAFLMNSTTYLTGFMAGDNLPGNNQGMGLMNVARALDTVPRMLVDQDRTVSNTGQTITITGRIADPTKPFRVTLAWTDAPGTPLASAVVNDLDLQVEVGSKAYLGNRFDKGVSIDGGTADRLNNVESVWAPGGTSGTFAIHIVAANIVGDGIPGNNDLTDQDFALVIYNGRVEDGGGGGGGGEPPIPVDSPPTVNVKYPVGGEKLMVGNFVRILWDASDDKGLQNQRVEFSADGVTFNTIGVVDDKARNFDWRIPSVPTSFGRIRITVLDGVNLPVSSTSPASFEIAQGPPDNTPPQVLLISPNTKTILGGGMPMTVKWKESDNIGVIQRVIELSTDAGETFQQIISLVAPSSGEDQSYNWQVPATFYTDKAKVRVTVYDGAGNSAAITTTGKFDIWPMPIITEAQYVFGTDGGRDELVLIGRNFRVDDTEIWANGTKLGKIRFSDKFYSGDGSATKIFSRDKKLHKRIPARADVTIEIRLPKTGQISPGFAFRRSGGPQQ